MLFLRFEQPRGLLLKLIFEPVKTHSSLSQDVCRLWHVDEGGRLHWLLRTDRNVKRRTFGFAPAFEHSVGKALRGFRFEDDTSPMVFQDNFNVRKERCQRG